MSITPRRRDLDQFLQSPGAGPSILLHSDEGATPSRESLLARRCVQLAQISETHDDLVRELFQLEHFRSLTRYDPAEAKKDTSVAFVDYKARYDLFRNIDHASPRKTRGAAQNLRQLLKPGPSSLPPKNRNSLSLTQDRWVANSPASTASNQAPPISSSAYSVGQAKPDTPPSKRRSSPAPPKTPKRLRLILSKPSPAASPPGPTADPPPDSPTVSSRPLKRIKLIHRTITEFTAPDQLPPPTGFQGSLSALLQSFYFVDESDTVVTADDVHQLEEMADEEAALRRQIQELRISGRIGLYRTQVDPTPIREPSRRRSHWDNLLDHVTAVNKVMKENVKARTVITKRISRMIEKHFEDAAGAEERSQKALEKQKSALVRQVLKAILKEWRAAVSIVRARLKEEEKAEQVRKGKEHLDAFLQHSSQILEVQHADLGVVRSRGRSKSHQSNDEPAASNTSHSQSPPSRRSPSSDSIVEAQLSKLDSNSDNDLEIAVPSSALGLVMIEAAPLSAERPDTILEPPLPNPMNLSQDEEYVPLEHRNEEDARLAADMEAAELESDEEELTGLRDDANVPIETLLELYGYPVPSGGASTVAHTPEPGTIVEDNSPSAQTARDDRDFVVTGDQETTYKEDRQLEREMEAEDNESVESDIEIKGLSMDAEIPLQELLRRYLGHAVDDDPASPTFTLDQVPGGRQSPGFSQVSSPSVVDGDSDIDRSSVQDAIELQHIDSASGELDNRSVTDMSDGDSNNASLPEPGMEVDDAATSSQILPPFLLRGTLRPYQQAGLEWLATLYLNSVNGILADEMGLGKTIQTIALLGWLACSKRQWGPHLIVVPTSVLLNWEMEFKRFLPGFKVLSYYGSQKERKEKRQGWNAPYAFNVCITSYQLALADQTVFRRKKWVYMILDEAHNIKNFKSKRWETLLCFNAQRRLLLTGTPLQNNLMELWSLLYFLMPDEGFIRETEDAQLFVRREDFKDLFQNPVERAIESGNGANDETKATVLKLHALLRPYLLRRMKAEVEKQLPSKYEHLLYCRLSKRQRFLYDEFMSRAATKETLASGNFMSIVNCLMQLRKVCNHPALFEVRPIVTSFVMSRSAAADFEIKDLLVRRRLLWQADNDNEIALPGLQITHSSPPSLLALRSTRRFNASSSLPYVMKLPDTPPPADTKTIAGWKAYRAYQARAAENARWKHMAYVNSRKCDQSTVYPIEVLSKFGNHVYPLTPLIVADKDRVGYLNRVDAVHALVKSYPTRAEEMGPIIDRFAFATPRVVALDLPRLALPSPVAEAVENYQLDVDFDILHHPSVKLQIAFPDPSLIQFDCGKLQELDRLLRKKAAGGHRVLIFTQMTRVLDILEVFLNLHGYRYLRLDGATKIEQRQIITERFNVDSKIFAFIASSRSGGVGINLTGADTVIFYDSDYNPSMDRQCEDRAHRIGQTREVHIYRLISSHTVEEAMLKKANQKRSLDDMVIQKGEFDWRKMLADEMEDGRSTRRLEEAMAATEDVEDARAAKVAAAEVSLDDPEFEQDAMSDGGTEPEGHQNQNQTQEDEGEAPEDDEPGSIGDYMIRWVEEDWDFFGSDRRYGSR